MKITQERKIVVSYIYSGFGSPHYIKEELPIELPSLWGMQKVSWEMRRQGLSKPISAPILTAVLSWIHEVRLNLTEWFRMATIQLYHPVLGDPNFCMTPWQPVLSTHVLLQTQQLDHGVT